MVCLREGFKWSSFLFGDFFRQIKKAGTESPTRSFYGGARPNKLLRTDKAKNH